MARVDLYLTDGLKESFAKRCNEEQQTLSERIRQLLLNDVRQSSEAVKILEAANQPRS